MIMGRERSGEQRQQRRGRSQEPEMSKRPTNRNGK
jgi:hypothetical protein